MFDNLKSIRLFVAAYEERSFTGAAAREHATQSGVSQQIRKLEARAGMTLFARGHGVSVRPTPAGDAYYQSCIEILRAHSAMRQTMHAYAGGLDGEIRIGFSPTVARSVLVGAHAQFSEQHPNVEIGLFEAYTGGLSERLRRGELDFAIGVTSGDEAGIRTSPFASTPDLLVAGPSSTLKNRVPVRLRDLPPLRLVVPSTKHARRAHIDAYIVASGARVERILELEALSSTLCFVEEGDWMALQPALAMLPALRRDQGLALCPLLDPPMSLHLTLMEPASRSLSPAADAFLTALRHEMRRATDLVAELLG